MAKSKLKLGSNLSTAILYILLGLALAIFRTQALGLVMTVVGVCFVVFGILDLLNKKIGGGIFSILVGVVVILLGWLLVKIVLLVLGIVIAIKGIIALKNELTKKNRTLLGLLVPILSIVFGLLLAFGNGIDIILIIVGIFFIVNGVLAIIGAKK